MSKTTTDLEKKIKSLNNKQKEAVTLPYNQSAFILSGAGSGKTSVLTTRIAYLINQGLNPKRILAVTFTNKAAKEMKERIELLVSKSQTGNLMMGTFHSICSRILRENYQEAGLKKNFAIIDTSDQKTILRKLIKEKDESLLEDNKFINELINFIGKRKETIAIDDYMPELIKKSLGLSTQKLMIKFYDAYIDFCEENNIEKEGKKILKQLEKVIFTIPNINYYEEDEQTPDKAVNIFIRINSGGTYLSFSDILMSIAVANWKNIDARTEIHQLVDNIRAKGYTIDKDYILKAFLYLYHKDIRFQINSFNNEFIERIEANWNDIRDAIISLFDLIKSFGLIDYTLTAKNATLPILYYIYHRNIYRGYSDKVVFQDERKTIKKWLLTILVRQIFSSQTDSVLSQSRRGFTIDIEKEKIDENISSFPFDKINDEIKKFSDISEDNIEELLLNQKDKQYTFSILALLYPNLDYKNNNFHQDHLHPASKYDSLSQEDKDKYGWNIYNSILNLQMLGANENESKNNSDLKDWVNREVKDKGDSYRDSFLEDHIIPDVDLDINNFSVFVEARKNILVNKLKKLLSQ